VTPRRLGLAVAMILALATSATLCHVIQACDQAGVFGLKIKQAEKFSGTSP